MEEHESRKEAYKYIVGKAKTHLVVLPNYSDKRLAETFDIPVIDLISLKEGKSDPSPKLVSAFKDLFSPHAPETEVDFYLITPFLTKIKAVFFDLYHTLVRYEPPQEELQATALKEFGIEVGSEVFRRPIVIADEFIYQEIIRTPLSQLSAEDKTALYARYQGIVLKEAGIEATDKLVLGLLGKMRQFDMKLVLFDDVVPVLTDLKRRGLILGLISNVDRDITPLLNQLGLTSLLQVVVTSQDMGFNKPNPEMFQEALRRAGVQASEAIYVGDQYQIDVVGANNVGMKGVLLDRGDYFEEITDCPRLRNLTQSVEYL